MFIVKKKQLVIQYPNNFNETNAAQTRITYLQCGDLYLVPNIQQYTTCKPDKDSKVYAMELNYKRTGT